MSRSKVAAPSAEIAQGEPTRPRPVDANGLELDEWGLPLCGPARVEALSARGLPDPNLEPEAWASPAVTEEDNG